MQNYKCNNFRIFEYSWFSWKFTNHLNHMSHIIWRIWYESWAGQERTGEAGQVETGTGQEQTTSSTLSRQPVTYQCILRRLKFRPISSHDVSHCSTLELSKLSKTLQQSTIKGPHVCWWTWNWYMPGNIIVYIV